MLLKRCRKAYISGMVFPVLLNPLNDFNTMSLADSARSSFFFQMYRGHPYVSQWDHPGWTWFSVKPASDVNSRQKCIHKKIELTELLNVSLNDDFNWFLCTNCLNYCNAFPLCGGYDFPAVVSIVNQLHGLKRIFSSFNLFITFCQTVG